MADEPSNSQIDKSLSVAFEGPAVAASRVFVSIVGTGVRLSFVEEHKDNQVHFRTAAVIPIPVALSLRDVLNNVLSNVEDQIKAAEAEALKDRESDG